MKLQGLSKVDIAEMNLLCAVDLPGAENLDIDHCLSKLDQWAGKARAETQRHAYRVQDPRFAERYKGSVSRFRAEFLLQVLQEDCGVHYNMDRVENIDFRRSQDLFLHGLIGDGNGGTCVSMPVLYVAVGRRLGYPLKLVRTKEHVFCRWEDGRERFNIEGAGKGFASFADAYYKTWPKKASEAEIKANRYLVSLTPREELASFLASRGHCLLDNGYLRPAWEAYLAARRLAPATRAYAVWATRAQRRLFAGHYAARAPRRPRRAGATHQDPTARIDRINAAGQAGVQPGPQPPPPMPLPPIKPKPPRTAPQSPLGGMPPYADAPRKPSHELGR